MRMFRRGIVAGALTVTFVVGVAPAASAQGQPSDMLSPSPTAAAVGVPNATVGYRFRDAAVVVVVPDVTSVDDATLRTIDQAVWTIEPVRFRHLEVRSVDQVLSNQSYTELTRTLGKRPVGLEKSSLQSLADSLDRATEVQQGTLFKWIQAIAFAVVCGVIAIMLVVALFVLVSAEWRRARNRELHPPTGA